MSDLDSSVEIVEVSPHVTMVTSGVYGQTQTPRGVDSPTRRHSLLESVSAKFQQNRQDMAERVDRMRSKQSVERAHSQYLKHSVVPGYQLAQARPVVEAWAQRNGRCRPTLTARQRDRLQELETVDHRHVPVRNISASVLLNTSNNADVYNERCAVIGCGMMFTSRQQHKLHNRQFDHTPCSALLQMPNGCLSDPPLEYICPKCGEGFQRSLVCQEHMVMSDHLSLFSPLAVCAYMCPECLMFFPEKMACHAHIEDSNHFSAAYPFTDDMKDIRSCPRTIPVPRDLAVDFVSRTSHVPYTVSCLQCELVVQDNAGLRDHWRDTAGKEDHVFIATSDVSLVEVFAGYLGHLTCDTCLQILGPESRDGAVHRCSLGIQGKCVEMNCQSLGEFVRRCGLTLGQHSDTAHVEATASESSVIVISPVSRPLPSGHSVTASLSSTLVEISDNEDNVMASFGGKKGKIQQEAESSPSGRYEMSKVSIMPWRKGALWENSESSSEENLASPPHKRCKTQHEPESERTCPGSISRPSNQLYPGQVSTLLMDLIDSALPAPTIGESIPVSSCNTKSIPVHTGIVSPCKTQSIPIHLGTSLGQPSMNLSNAESIPVSPCDAQSIPVHTGIVSPCDAQSIPVHTGIVSPCSIQSIPVSPCDAQSIPVHTGIVSPCSIQSIPVSPSNDQSIPVHTGTVSPCNDQSIPVHTGSVSPCNAQSIPVHTGTVSPCDTKFIPVSPFNAQSIPVDTGTVSPCNTQLLSGQQGTSADPRSVSQPTSELIPAGVPENVEPRCLDQMKLLIFLDLDNWGGFFKRLTRPLPDQTFVWAFYGAGHTWKPPTRNAIYQSMMAARCIHFHKPCGRNKDAADFALCLMLGKMHERLPLRIPFAVLSADKGFLEVERQMLTSGRRTVVIDPHHAVRDSDDMLYTLIISVLHDS